MRWRPLLRWLPAVAIVVGVVVAGFVLLGDDDKSKLVAVTSSAETFATLDELVTASDVVVVGTVTGSEDGRTITSPNDPDAGIRTRLVELDVTQTLHGEPPERLVVEEAEAFTDGTPIAVDAMDELREGDRAVWFLVTGGDEAMPYYATVNGQARYRVVGDMLDPAGDDALSQQCAALGPDGLIDAIIAV